MSPVILQPPLKISREQTEEFVLAVIKALIGLPLEDLQQAYLFHDGDLVISYSSNYEPFIGFTMSYNDPDYRLYINQHSDILLQIGEALDFQGRDIPGGRVFIERRYAYIKDENFNHRVILLLDWQGIDPCKAIELSYQSIVNGLST